LNAKITNLLNLFKSTVIFTSSAAQPGAIWVTGYHKTTVIHARHKAGERKLLVLYFLSFLCFPLLLYSSLPKFCLDVFLGKGNYGFLTLRQVQAVSV